MNALRVASHLGWRWACMAFNSTCNLSWPGRSRKDSGLWRCLCDCHDSAKWRPAYHWDQQRGSRTVSICSPLY